jgi:hypothetical protein
MRIIVKSAATLMSIFGLGGGPVFAMGGGGNLSPSQSPYAILAPITVAPFLIIDGRAAYANGKEMPGPGEFAPAPGGFRRLSPAKAGPSSRPKGSANLGQ